MLKCLPARRSNYVGTYTLKQKYKHTYEPIKLAIIKISIASTYAYIMCRAR